MYIYICIYVELVRSKYSYMQIIFYYKRNRKKNMNETNKENKSIEAEYGNCIDLQKKSKEKLRDISDIIQSEVVMWSYVRSTLVKAATKESSNVVFVWCKRGTYC